MKYKNIDIKIKIIEAIRRTYNGMPDPSIRNIESESYNREVFLPFSLNLISEVPWPNRKNLHQIFKELVEESSAFNIYNNGWKILEENKKLMQKEIVIDHLVMAKLDDYQKDIQSGPKLSISEEDGSAILLVGKKQIVIGRCRKRPHKLIQLFYYRPQTFVSIDEVFRAILIDGDEKDKNLIDPHTSNSRKIGIIENAIGEIQRKRKISGILNFEFDKLKKNLQMILF